MTIAIFYIDYDAALSLQSQLRQRIIEAIVGGSLEPGARLPSSRRLSNELGVARNTVTLAYQQLIADGYLAGRERSGVFVAAGLFEGGSRERAAPPPHAPPADRPWRAHLKPMVRLEGQGRAPPNWELNPYPFLDGRYDTSLSPLAEWRDAVRSALSGREFADWSSDGGEADDPRLLHEIRTKVLPRRGVQAGADQILIVDGAKAALDLLCRAFAARGARAVIEEPGLPDLAPLLRLQGATVLHQPVDAHGLVVDERMRDADLIFLTPSRHFATSAPMSLDRRKAVLEIAASADALVVEYDLPASGGFTEKVAPALQSMDPQGRVIYLADLCDVLSPGLGLGFIVAGAELIRELRKLRSLTVGHPPRAAQRTGAYFLSLGHYDAMMARQHRELRERLIALRDALNYHLPQLVAIDPRSNGAAMWVEGPEDLPAGRLAKEAARRGVLIEPADRFYSGAARPANHFRMGVTGIPKARIRDGVAVLAQVIRELSQPHLDRLDPARPSWLDGEALARLMAGSKLLCRTAYGDPYEVDVRPDGVLIGKAGYAHEDCDEGRWWIEEDRWCRQWNAWSYGDTAKFLTVVDGDQIRWYRDDYLLFNRGVVIPNHPSAA